MNEQQISNSPFVLNSQVCIGSLGCFPVQTELPGWMLALLAVSALFVAKEVYQTITK